ncbi:MAG: LPS export ABC transporter permease LptG [Candidatus Delongbacteria bacterium]|jgi:lipopolysaccharide export system permease protein|nr:LPS export ABC transporter permease LptG [Candidatus Delongbacteria bacterium]
MIRRLDIYVLKKFFMTLLFAMAAMIMIYVVIDLFDHLNKFLDAKMPLLGYIIYYTLKIPEIISQIFPVVSFMSLLFTLGNLSKYREIVAMMTSGISLARIATPFIIAGIFLSVFHFYFSEIVLPIASRKHYEAQKFYLKKGRKFTKKSNEYIYQEKNSIVYISHYDNRTKVAQGVSIQGISHGRITFRLDAETMKYNSDKWLLKDVTKRSFFPDSTSYKHLDSLHMFLDFKPTDIKEIELKPVEMGWFELDEYISSKRKLGIDMTKWEVEKMSKISYSLITLVLILLAIPLSTGRVRSSTSVSFGISVGISFIYYLLIIMFKNWGAVGTLNVVIASWTPDIIFGSIGILLLKFTK